MLRLRLTILIIPMALLSGCDSFDAPTVVGSGVIKTETRTITDCSEVELYGVGELTIHFGDQPSLSITADDNMLQYVLSEVEGDKLSIGVGPGNYTWTGFPKIELTVSSIDSLTLSGQTQAIATDLDTSSVTVTADGQCSVTLGGKIEELTVHLTGQSACTATDLEGHSASIIASGQCSTTLAGRLESLEIELEGQSLCDAGGLDADSGTVHAAGQCTVNLPVLQNLDAVADGQSNVSYRGDPELTVTTTGQATVTKQE